ncbi:ABC transporter permease [Promicromonospora sp. NPDC090134]|uniref:ABC transporter permease n=1 Tax=Promicromonospora sp. NPDC090134 TaxID=3364408 RepID=UPI00382EED55
MTTATATPLVSQAAANPLPSLLRHVETEIKDFWRSIISLAFIVLMPIGFYVGFGFAFRAQGGTVLEVGEHSLTQANLSYAGVLTFGMISVALANVAIGLAIRRHHGIFRRLRTTPVRPWVVTTAYLVNGVLTAIVVVAAVTLLGTLALNVHVEPERVPALLAALVLGFVCIAPLGTALSLLPPSADAAVPIINGIFFPLAFLSGAFMRLPLGEVGDAIVSYLPGAPLMTLVTSAVATSGPVWDARATWILLAWGLAGAVVSLRFFRWTSEREPRGFSSQRRADAE